jgi:hypothetical protein
VDRPDRGGDPREPSLHRTAGVEPARRQNNGSRPSTCSHSTAAALGWAESEKVTHPALVDEATFLAIQCMRAARPTKSGGTRTYMLAGLVQCQLCGRRLDSHWVNGRPSYCCRHGHTSARNRPPELAKNVYVREDHLLGDLRSRFPETADEDGPAIADYLRSNNLTIMRGGPTREVRACSPPYAHVATAETAEEQLLLL